jgi:hypothetical protein
VTGKRAKGRNANVDVVGDGQENLVNPRSLALTPIALLEARLEDPLQTMTSMTRMIRILITTWLIANRSMTGLRMGNPRPAKAIRDMLTNMQIGKRNFQPGKKLSPVW